MMNWKANVFTSAFIVHHSAFILSSGGVAKLNLHNEAMRSNLCASLKTLSRICRRNRFPHQN
jgi:hypothetical protein